MHAPNTRSFSAHRVVGVRFHSRDDILVCVDSSNRFRLLDIEKRRLAACHDDVEFPQVPSGKGAWGGAGDVHPLSGIAFNPEDPLHSMLLFNHRYVRTCLLVQRQSALCCGGGERGRRDCRVVVLREIARNGGVERVLSCLCSSCFSPILCVFGLRCFLGVTL